MMEAFIAFPIVKPKVYNVNKTNKHLVIVGRKKSSRRIRSHSHQMRHEWPC